MSRKDVLTNTATPFRIPLIMGGTCAEIKEGNEEIERPVDDMLFFPGLLPGESKGLVKEGKSSAFSKDTALLHCLD